MTDEQYAAWLHQELADSKSQIETQTGRPVRFLSYPYGDFDRAVESEAALDGYIIALRSREGWNNRRSNPLELKRFLIESDTTLDRFRADLGALDLLVKDLSPASEGIIPPAQKIISATVPEVGQFDPDSIHIALLGDDRATPSWDPAARQISLTLNGTLAPGRHHVVVWARRLRDGKRAVALWTFYTSGPEKKRYDAMRVQLLELPLHHMQTQAGAAP